MTKYIAYSEVKSLDCITSTGAEVRDGILYKVWMEDFGPYDPEEMKEEVRKATEDDIHACHVLERLQADYKGWEYAKR